MRRALQRAYLRQKLRWLESDLSFYECEQEVLPDRIRATRGRLSALRVQLVDANPPDTPRRRWGRSVLRALLSVYAAVALLGAWSAKGQESPVRHIADMSDGSVWGYWPSTLSGAGALSFVVQRERAGATEVYRFEIAPTECARAGGEARLSALDGTLLERSIFRFASSGETSTLARALCAAWRRGLT